MAINKRRLTNNYEPSDEQKRDFINEQVRSMQLSYYRNKLDRRKIQVLREQTDERWQGTYDTKLNELTLQDGEIETAIDLMTEELDTLG